MSSWNVGSDCSMEDIAQKFLWLGAIHADNPDDGIPVGGRLGKADLDKKGSTSLQFLHSIPQN